MSDVGSMKRIIYLAIAQFALMNAVVVLLLSFDDARELVVEHFGFLTNIVPSFWRYERFFLDQGRSTEWPVVFAVRASNVLLQTLFLLLFLWLWHGQRRVLQERSKGPGMDGRKRSALFYALVLLMMVPTMLMLFGPVHVGTYGRTNLIIGTGTFRYFELSIALPCANLVLFLLLFFRLYETYSLIDPSQHQSLMQRIYRRRRD